MLGPGDGDLESARELTPSASIQSGMDEEPHESRPSLLGAEPLSSTLRWYPPPHRKSTRRELLADRIINFSGMGLSLIACPLLVLSSRAAGDSFGKQLGFLAFGCGAVTMLSCSALFHYHSWRWSISEKLLSLDHIGISSMIMGAYVPPTLILGAWWTLAVVLSLGVLGYLIEGYKLCNPQAFSAVRGHSLFDKLQIVRYLVMGWAILPLSPLLLRTAPFVALAFSLAGGITYTLGVIFHVWRTLEYHMAIWHFLVLAASAMFFMTNVFLIGVPLPA